MAKIKLEMEHGIMYECPNCAGEVGWGKTIVKIVENHWNGWRMSMIKRGSKQSKVSRIDHSKALAAQTDEAIKERIRTAPASMYTPACARFRSCGAAREGTAGKAADVV